MSDRKARIAVIGCGRWSQGWHIPQLVHNPNAELGALCSGRQVPELAKKYSVPGFADVDQMLADGVVYTLDGVIIASPHANHFEIGMKCIEAGLHIFMEKPMTTDMSQAYKLTKAAQQAEAKGKIFMVNNTANWRDGAIKATKMVEQGLIGDIRHAMVMFATPLDFLFNNPEQKGWNEPTGAMLGNGFAWGQLAHTFGWLWMVSGLKPKEVYATMGKSENTNADVFDAASILCTNGATVSVSACGVIPGNKKHVQNRLFGLKGMLSYSGTYEIDEGDAHEQRQGNALKNEGELRLELFEGNDKISTQFEFENIEQGGLGPESLQAFVDACLGKRVFKGTTAEIGYLCAATISAMYRSAKAGEPVSVVPPNMWDIISSPLPPPPQRRAKIALIGAGRWSRGWHIPQLVNNPKSELAALASGRMVPALSKEYGVPGFENVDALLADPIAKTLDGIIIAAPHANHSDIGMKCIEAGLNILMEKPMTTDLLEAIKLTKAANKSKKVFMVNNTANWRKESHHATQLIAAGQIGDIRHAMVAFATPLGFIFNDPEQKGWVEPSGSMLGNGFAWGQLAHTFGWLWMVSGLKPESVFAFMGKSDKTSADVYDAATITCTNGATVSVSAVGVIPGKAKWVQNRLFGLEGTLTYNGFYEIDEGDAHEEGSGPPQMKGELKMERFDGKDLISPNFEFENIEQGGEGPESLHAFIDACLNDSHFRGTTADIGFLCVATIDAMYRSAKSGKPEPLLPPEMFEAWVA